MLVQEQIIENSKETQLYNDFFCLFSFALKKALDRSKESEINSVSKIVSMIENNELDALHQPLKQINLIQLKNEGHKEASPEEADLRE